MTKSKKQSKNTKTGTTPEWWDDWDGGFARHFVRGPDRSRPPVATLHATCYDPDGRLTYIPGIVEGYAWAIPGSDALEILVHVGPRRAPKHRLMLRRVKPPTPR